MRRLRERCAEECHEHREEHELALHEPQIQGDDQANGPTDEQRARDLPYHESRRR